MTISIFRKYKTFPFILLLILLLSSCSNSAQRNLASTDIIKNAENEIVEGEYRYIVNKRTGKIHTYHHGMNSGMNPDNMLMTNDSLEMILEDEEKDLCRNCWAGIKTNLKSYDDNTLDLIEKFMRLYDFTELDIETQKFLMCIFEVGEWYVDNVYTYQGGKQTVLETETIAKTSASESAYKRWRNYLSSYSSFHIFRDNSKILPVAYDKLSPTIMTLYKCDLFEKTNYPKGNTYDIKSTDGVTIYKNAHKNNFVCDDCSKFAAAVYYYYVNKEKLIKNFDIDLWYTSSYKFSFKNELTNVLIESDKFHLYTLENLKEQYEEAKKDGRNFSYDLKIGDLIQRDGHVEFYIGNNKVINWGRIHNTYTLNKFFHFEDDGFHSNDPNDKEIPYTTIIRFMGD